MTPHPRLSVAAIDLVKRFEGLRQAAARLDDGGWTIGYGHTASAREGTSVTAEQAEILLTYDLDRVARAIDPLIFTPLTDNQFNALVAFAFNIGVEAFRASAVLKRVNEGAYLQAAAAIELWRRAPFEGETLVIDGLVRRRAAEKLLFLTPPDGFRPVPTPVVRAACDAPAAEPSNEARPAADLRVPLDGDRAVAERTVEDAAQDVTVRLRQLYPDREPEPHPAAPPSPAEPGSEQPALVEAVEEGETPFDEPPPPPFATPAQVQRLLEPQPRRTSLEEVAAPAPPVPPEAPAAAFGRRGAVEAPSRAVRRLAPSHRALIVGAAGVVMFVGALLAMVLGKATVANLVVGLVGVALMTPAALSLARGLFDERPNSP